MGKLLGHLRGGLGGGGALPGRSTLIPHNVFFKLFGRSPGLWGWGLRVWGVRGKGFTGWGVA